MKYQNSYEKQGCFFKTRPCFSKMPNRTIITNVVDDEVCDNSIKTSKYTTLSFVPLNLIVQFSKVANVYFLIIGLMQMVKAISVSGGFPVIFLPLSIVVSVSAFKDYLEDLKRKSSDNQINSQIAYKLTKKGFEAVKWQTLKIGDVIKVKKNQQFPGDIILLQSSDEKRSCFIQTKNLDGQTNLKYKQVKYQVSLKFDNKSQKQIYKCRQQFKYQRPNPYIHTFTGSNGCIPIDNNNVILRGCMLKITDWVSGVIVYSGYDTKIMLNSNNTRQKKSRLQFKMGIIVAYIFLTQMIITLISAIMSVVMVNKLPGKQDMTSFLDEILIKWGSWILLFTNFVPISLIVSLEMVKYIQGINIKNSTFRTTAPAEVSVQTSTLNQQLGQIQHLFSDKTGTLTRNYMSFKYMAIGTNVYGYDDQKTIFPQHITNVDFHDKQFIMNLANSKGEGEQQHNWFNFLTALALCHNVIIEVNEKGQKKYNASSPDELAFINMAKLCGWTYSGMNNQNQMCFLRKQQTIKYKLLHVIDFNSDRKRMSVILQKDSRIFVFCKGADNVILERLKNKDTPNISYTTKLLQQWSIEGLRTLLFSMRQIKKQYYVKWAKMYAYSLSKLQKLQKKQTQKIKKQYINNFSQKKLRNVRMSRISKEDFNIKKISKFILDDYSNFEVEDEPAEEKLEDLVNKLLNDNFSLTQHQKRFLENNLENLDKSFTGTTSELQEMIERELQLIGATAIQDKLQDRVKQTIQSIRNAGVKVWMLTGDKRQTAINIGRSCGLVSENMFILKFNNSVDETLNQRKSIPINRQCCLVITGDDLLAETEEQKLLKLVNSCEAIIACRVTPKQKQDMVWLMRKNKYTTMGVGDGANDVNMINTAHVGIGIKGVQGAQAALCSDYAISQFQILGQLMLYHGRQCYRKNSQLILFNFYKNLILVLPQLWFGFNNHFTGTTLYDPWIYQLYNVVYTSFPIIIFAVFDQEYSVSYSMKHPQIYKSGLQNKMFNFSRVLLWFFTPCIYAFILCAMSFLIFEESVTKKGQFSDFLSAGMTIFVECVIICNLKVIVITCRISYGLLLLSFSGILMVYLSCLFSQWFFPFSDSVNIMEWQLSNINYWIVVLLSVWIVMIFQYGMAKWEQLGKYKQNLKQNIKVYQEIQLPFLKYQNQ